MVSLICLVGLQIAMGVTSCAAFDNPGFTATSVKVEEADKGIGSHGKEKWPRPPVNGHRKKKVIMGRDFLLVSCDWLRESKSSQSLQFFHKPSLLVAVVKVQARSTTDLNPFDAPVTGQENTPVVKIVDKMMV